MTVASVEREPITGSWSPQRGLGAEPWSGVRGKAPWN